MLAVLASLVLLVVALACGDDDGPGGVAGGGAGGTATAEAGDDGDGPGEEGDNADGADSSTDGGGDGGDEPGEGDGGDDGDSPADGDDDDGPGDGDDGPGDGEPDDGTANPTIPVDWPDLIEACSLLTPAQVTGFLKQPGEVVVNEHDRLPLFSSCFWQTDTGEGMALHVVNMFHPYLAELYVDGIIANMTGEESIAGAGDRAYWQPINGRMVMQEATYVVEILPEVSLSTYPEGELLRQSTIELGQQVLAALAVLN